MAAPRITALVVVLLGFLDGLGSLSIDLYLPAFPVLREELRATDTSLQLTLSAITFGLAVGHLVTGAWSDRVGRRGPLLASGALHVVATIGCALSPTVEVLVVFRFVQGFAAAGSAVLVLAIIRDVTEGPTLIRMLARVGMVTTLVPLAAPAAGAGLLEFLGWRGIFGCLAGLSAVLLVGAALLLSETHHGPRTAQPLWATGREVLADHSFRWATVVICMSYAGIFAYVAASPILLQEVHGLAAGQYAAVFLANSIGVVVGVQLGAVVAERFGERPAIAFSAVTTLLVAGAIMPLHWLGAGLPGLLACLWLSMLGYGACFPAAEALALGGQGAHAGTAASINGFAKLAVAGLLSPVAGMIGLDTAGPLAVIMICTALVSLSSAFALGRPRRSARMSDPRPRVSAS